MFEKPIILPLEIFSDASIAKMFFDSLTLREQIKITNKLLNDFYTIIDPQIAIKLILPQKMKLLEANKKIKSQLLLLYPELEFINTHEQLFQKFSHKELKNIYHDYYKFNHAYYESCVEDNLSHPDMLKQGVRLDHLFPLLPYIDTLDDDHIQYPQFVANNRKQSLLFALNASIKQLKSRFKHNPPEFEYFEDHFMPLVKITQKINAMLLFYPPLENCPIVPLCADWCKILEWVLHNVIIKQNIEKLSNDNAQIFTNQRALLITTLDTLYLFTSEKIAYFPSSSLEELNYAEWCSDKFYSKCLSDDHDLLKKTFSDKLNLTIDSNWHKQVLIAQYQLNMTIIESKRGSHDSAIEHYEDFLNTIENGTHNNLDGLLDKIFVNLTFLLPRMLANPNQHFSALSILDRSITICQYTEKFSEYNDFQKWIKNTKLDLFSMLLKNHLKDKEHMIFKVDAQKDILEISLSLNYAVKKPNSRKKFPASISGIHYFTQTNQIKLDINLNAMPLKSELLSEQLNVLVPLIQQGIIVHKVFELKPKNKPSLLISKPTESSASTELVIKPLQEIEQKAELIPPCPLLVTSPVASTEELTNKLSKLLLDDSLPEKTEKTKKTEKSEKSRKAHSLTLQTPTRPHVFTAKEIGFKQYPTQTVTPVYFGLNQKKKSTNTYLVWDKVNNLDSGAEQHFKSMLDENGMNVAKNVDDAGVKIHRPPSQKNDPNFAFIRLKSKSKLYAGTRVYAEFKEEAVIAGKPIYLYSFGKARHK